MDIQSYKCPCCGSILKFDPESGNLSCDSCKNEYSVETLELLESSTNDDKGKQFNWQEYTPRSFSKEEVQTLAGYNCPSCNAQITGDATLGATICPYCGNSAIIKGQFEDSLRPDYIIPFKIDKKEAMSRFEAACKGAPFLPDEFKNKKKIEEISGIYIPFWTFDCKSNASISYDAERVHYFSDAKYNYTKTDHYRLLRSGSVNFSNVPVDGSLKADNDYTESLEPFDYSEAVDFNTAYLSGYLADRYDVSGEECVARANERIKESTNDIFIETAAGYTGVTTTGASFNFTENKIRYSLLPVWMLNIKYNKEGYKFLINGQTGKVVGRFPVCRKKQWMYFLKAYLITFAVVVLIGTIWLMIGGK